MWCKAELRAMDFIRFNQSKLRAELYHGVVDAIDRGDYQGDQIGRKVILPSSVTGSPRQMQQCYQDSMARARKFSKASLFVTMTCNPDWPEIKDALLPGEQPSDRPDLIARVFR
jgi:hypothetical protein